MEETKQNTEMNLIQLNHEFYYTLALMQFEAIKYVAAGENDGDRCKRANSVIEQVREIIKQVGEVGFEHPPCLPPCKWDSMWRNCNCPHIKCPK